MCYFCVQPSVFIAYDRHSSSAPSPVSAIIIWCLVIHFIHFRVYLTFVIAVILILKHATFLSISMDAESALTLVDMDYQAANIDLKIQEHLASSLQEHTVDHFAHFSMATDIGVLILAPVNKSLIKYSALSQSSIKMDTSVHTKGHWFKQFWESVSLHKSRKYHSEGQVNSMASGSWIVVKLYMICMISLVFVHCCHCFTKIGFCLWNKLDMVNQDLILFSWLDLG